MNRVFSIQWHITTKCEQRCKHCYLYNSVDGKKEIQGEKLISYDDLKKVVDDLVDSCKKFEARPRISLTGGNPILHSRFWELLKYIQVSNVKAGILGNPFGITDEIAKKLSEHGITKYQLSLDGMKEVHDYIREPGSFEATTKTIDILKRNGINVTIMTTVSKLNMHDVPKIVEHVVDLGVSSYAFARYCSTDSDTDDMFTPNEYRDFLSVMWDIYSKHDASGVNFVLKDHLWYLFLMEENLFQPEDTDGMIVGGCGLGISHLSVLADGTVYACRRFKSPVGNIQSNSLYEIFMNSKMDNYRNYLLMKKCNNCELMPYCRGCMAVTHCSTGDWTLADPQCWK